MAAALMVQGTTSDAGKTTLVAGLGRVLSDRGLSVAPFKPQNMALNSAVTPEGGEIGRAQALQAMACRVAPHTDMNPVLLKPSSDIGAQVIIDGLAYGNMDARTYHAFKPEALGRVMDAYRRLCTRFDFVLIEGAGSPAEINLRDGDIANMGFAEAADCPVVLVADIDKGGVFAHVIGTLACLSPSERARVTGFVINKFRGDQSLLTPGIAWLEKETGKPVLGVLPYWHGLYLDGEDAIDQQQERDHAAESITVIVPVLSRISNHTDFDGLRQHPQVDLRFVGPGEPIPPADLIILPGSKNVPGDLLWLSTHGWEVALDKHLRYGGKLLGICGGFQMLGRTVADPQGLEGAPGTCRALGYLELDTVLAPHKQLHETRGSLCSLPDAPTVTGYEIHCGTSTGAALERPALELADGRRDGAVSSDGQILGTYLHGLFDLPQAMVALLRWAGLEQPQAIDRKCLREAAFDRIALDIDTAIDIDKLLLPISAQGRHRA